MFELSVQGHFASAHQLRGYDGPCKDVHDHTWKTEVTVQSGELNDIGLVIDFKDIKSKLNQFLDQIDHVNLNDLDYFKTVNPTTENLAKFIYNGFGPAIAPLKLVRVRVWESDTSSVVYYE